MGGSLTRAAAEQFHRALPGARGKSRLTILQNLGVLRDTLSIGALKQALNNNDREARLAAVWALANIGDAGSTDAVEIVVLWDEGGDWDSRIHHIQYDENPDDMSSPMVNHWGEVNMGDPQTLVKFAVWAIDHYPA